eukprot:scaffold170972_cov22-Tisochrysis_lutea.AAC.1
MCVLCQVSELAALCPGTEQRSELLRAHREYLASPAANNAGPGGLCVKIAHHEFLVCPGANVAGTNDPC